MEPVTYFVGVGIAAAIIVAVGLIVERNKLLKKIEGAEAKILTKLINAGVTRMKSAISNEVPVMSGEPPAPAPAVIIDVTMAINVATVKVQLPTLDTNGAPLQSLTSLLVYAMEKSFLGEVGTLLGMEPHIALDINLSQAGQEIPVTLTVPKFRTQYFFYAVVNG